jgi:membrane-associated phospholipid phosphatase
LPLAPGMAEFLFGVAPLIRVQHLFGPDWLLFFRALSELGTNWGVVLTVGLGFWLRGREVAYTLLAAVALEGAVHLLTNELFYTPRPEGPGLLKYEHVPLSSFPSGHVFTATVLWGLLYLRGLIPIVLSALVVAAVGLSRLCLGSHFVADVLGGVGSGILLLIVFIRVWSSSANRSEGIAALSGYSPCTLVRAR